MLCGVGGGNKRPQLQPQSLEDPEHFGNVESRQAVAEEKESELIQEYAPRERKLAMHQRRSEIGPVALRLHNDDIHHDADAPEIGAHLAKVPACGTATVLAEPPLDFRSIARLRPDEPDLLVI